MVQGVYYYGRPVRIANAFFNICEVDRKSDWLRECYRKERDLDPELIGRDNCAVD
jgi:hypothetical protein